VDTPSHAIRARLIFLATIALSALLLFLVQPVMGKVLLPRFGGVAAVWTTCMLFFQAVLLAGYVYAHWVRKRLPQGAQVLVHAGLLVASLPFLPVVPFGSWAAEAGEWPAAHILGILAVSVGLPCFLLSATSPLMQAWYVSSSLGPFPYRLFAASNAASLVALLAYPFAIEPALDVPAQLRLWSAAYGVFAALACASALTARKGRPIAAARDGRPGRTRLLWIALAATPCALWLAVANRVSQSVAAAPLLWILPLSLYLLSLILCFHRDGWYQPRVFRWLVPVAVAGLVAAIRQHSWSGRIQWGLLLFLGGLFVGCMFCHGELARRRPAVADLTGFYLAVALGGALGGAFVSLLAPVLFDDYLELPAAIVASILLALPLLYGYSSRRHLVRLAAAAVLVFVAASPSGGGSRLKERNFYGILEVRDHTSGDDRWRGLYNGTILHGSQYLSPERSREATTYYSIRSGVGLELQKMSNRRRRVGVIGLGPGTLATYLGEGDHVRFYEINPLVVQVAATEFRYLRECRGKVEVVAADARLALERESPQNFDLLAVDAFSGDAIPVHLLTREAFETYLRHLAPSGVLAVHVSAKYFNLAPLVVRTAESLGREARVARNDSDGSRQIASSTWVILDGARRPATAARVWSDRYSNLLEVIK
jgi:hypothetical protein